MQHFIKIQSIDTSKEGTDIHFRARVSTVRGKGGICFLLLRQEEYCIQAVASKSDGLQKDFIKACQSLSPESIIDAVGKIVGTDNEIAAATQKDVELKLKSFTLITRSDPLPLQITDASRHVNILESQRKELKAVQEELDNCQNDNVRRELEKKRDTIMKYVDVGQSTKLDNRILDLRTNANKAIFRLQSKVCQLFREFLLDRDFIEIHSPKLLGTASEGGANVFQVKYFDRPAFMAQSPQLYKQMAIMSDFNRVFEIGPVFRAENSDTHRHLCEFTGLDMEMAFNENYHEVLEIIGQMFHHIFSGLSKSHNELSLLQQQYNYEEFKFNEKPLVLQFKEGIQMLREVGVKLGDFDDLSTENEKLLGRLVKEKYDTDFYILDKFPMNIRPFYTMPDDKNPGYSNSYDMFMRGEEIVSGAQRIHDPELLTKMAQEKGVTLDNIKPYIDAFRYGAFPHAGCGIGLERVVMLFLGLDNIRKTSLFRRYLN